MRIITLILLSIYMLTFLSGCGGPYAKAEKQYRVAGVAPVRGTITLDGEPLAHAQIQFSENESLESSFCYGVTDENGEYSMNVDTYHEGALPGEKVVRIWTTLRGTGIGALMQGEYRKKEIIPVQYNQESTLSVKVEPLDSQVFDFDLKSGGKVSAAAPIFGTEEAISAEY